MHALVFRVYHGSRSPLRVLFVIASRWWLTKLNGKKAYYHLQQKKFVQPSTFINNVKIWLYKYIAVVIHSVFNKWAICSNQGKKWHFLTNTLIFWTTNSTGGSIYTIKYLWLFGYKRSDCYQLLMYSIRTRHPEYSRFCETCHFLVLKAFSLLSQMKLELQ